MNNLIDRFLSKVENIVNRPGHLMGMADTLLHRVVPTDIASAACPIFTEWKFVCRVGGCPSGLIKYKVYRICWFQSSACNIKVCNSWQDCKPACIEGCC